MDKEDANETFQFQGFCDSSDKSLTELEFFVELVVIVWRLFDGLWDLEANGFIKGTDVMSSNDVAILFHIFCDFGDGPCFLVIDCFVEESEGVFDFWIRRELQSRRV